jgi:hypothetical protein
MFMGFRHPLKRGNEIHLLPQYAQAYRQVRNGPKPECYSMAPKVQLEPLSARPTHSDRWTIIFPRFMRTRNPLRGKRSFPDLMRD